MQLSLFALGFLAGMGHALEPDHLAAVGSMATGKSSRAALVLRGAAWGMGHTITLFAICTAVILFGMALSHRMTASMESAVGVMLVLLGGEVLWRMHRTRAHVHVHQHAGGRRHVHVHSHLNEKTRHDARHHEHAHRHALPMKALLIGLVHGAAGSGALLVLVVATVPNPWLASFYVLLFGLGSMAGMASLSFAASWPLGVAERFAARFHQGFSLAIGLFAIILGVHSLLINLPAAWGGA